MILVTDDTTRAELEEAMANLVGTLHLMPAHWTERRAAMHERIDALLSDHATTCRTCGLSRARCAAVRGCCVQCRHE